MVSIAHGGSVRKVISKQLDRTVSLMADGSQDGGTVTICRKSADDTTLWFASTVGEVKKRAKAAGIPPEPVVELLTEILGGHDGKEENNSEKGC